MGKMEEVIEEQEEVRTLTLAEKIIAIMGEVQRLQKDDQVSFKNTNYKALSEEKVTAIMHEKLVKYKIFVYPVQQEWERTGSITHVNIKYRMVNAENPSDYIEIMSCGDGADTQDKGSGKAMTYAFKYMWLRTFALPTGEDPDKVSSDELDAKAEEAKAEAERQKIAKQKISDIKVKTLIAQCENDGVDVETILTLYKLEKIEDMTEVMLANCMKNWKKVMEANGNQSKTD